MVETLQGLRLVGLSTWSAVGVDDRLTPTVVLTHADIEVRMMQVY
jgi:hypothetical protein